jgi:hypothetical protein
VLNSYGLQAVVDVPTRIGHTSQTAIYQIILNKSIWGYTLKVIDTGLSDHKAQILQIQFRHKKRKGAFGLKEEYSIARSYRKENVQYLNYLLGKENWELVLKQHSVNEAYNAFSDTFIYYIAMPKKRVQTERQRNKWVTAGIRVSGNRLRFLNSLMKQGNMSEESKKYYTQYKKICNKVIREAKKLTNTMQMRASGDKVKTMWDLIKEENTNENTEEY